MDAPEVRLSPDGKRAAIRRRPEDMTHDPRKDLTWKTTNCGWMRDEDVSDWIPLLPASNKDGAS